MPNISRSKGNQTMKFGQLIECIMKNKITENHIQNVVEKLVPDPFLKNENWAYLWINWLNFQIVFFYCVPSWGLSIYMETRLHTLHLTTVKLFQKLKRGLGLASLPFFLHNLWRKIFLLTCFINWPSLSLLREILCNMCIVTVC